MVHFAGGRPGMRVVPCEPEAKRPFECELGGRVAPVADVGHELPRERDWHIDVDRALAFPSGGGAHALTPKPSLKPMNEIQVGQHAEVVVNVRLAIGSDEKRLELGTRIPQTRVIRYLDLFPHLPLAAFEIDPMNYETGGLALEHEHRSAVVTHP